MRIEKATAGLLLLACLVFSGCGAPKNRAASLTPVSVATVTAYSGPEGIRYSASIVPYSQVSLVFKSAGYITEILMRPGVDGRMRVLQQGDYVKKGTVVATVRKVDYVHAVQQYAGQLDQARAAATKAQQDFQRAQALYSANALTQPDYDAAKAQQDSTRGTVKTAQAALSEARQTLADCDLRAPIDSWVLNRNVEVGDFAATGTVGFTLGETRLVKAVFGVPDVLLSTLRIGQEQGVVTESLAQEFHGRITAISPIADQKSRTFEVEVTIPNPKGLLKAGMVATLDLGQPALVSPVAVVPLSAVVPSGAGPKGFAVFLVMKDGAQDVVKLQPVELGNTYGNQVAVVKGVTEGDHVVSMGATLVKDGQAVQIIP
ncbi:MAG TPA: efflux RND transporter periplasmic adaptor subunit [Verrucomicrobiae bacterium]|nr:efflux RND transporter periplasmic adaptor subunit [Verrucomicrobiae bacterium]